MFAPHIRHALGHVLLICLLLVSAGPAARAGTAATPNDTARFLAGMTPSPGSPLAALAQDPAWRQYARTFDTVWGKVEERQLGPINAWRQANLGTPQPTMFYMFSGPDYVYANAFFPDATTYVLSGLERIGPMPDISTLRAGKLGDALDHLWGSLDTILNWSYFITRDMQSRFSRAQLSGNLPVLYVFLARTGNTIREVSFVQLEPDGTEQTRRDNAPKGTPVGVKILFEGRDGKARTLYYFRTDLADGNARNSGFLKFCERLGGGDALVKSASYLLHYGTFSAVRNFLLEHAATIVQDDSGIALRYFPRQQWDLRTYGDYVGPIPIFRKLYQKDLAALFKENTASPVPFGIGYRYKPAQTNILLATRRGG
jgi:hypothetical protein